MVQHCIYQENKVCQVMLRLTSQVYKVFCPFGRTQKPQNKTKTHEKRTKSKKIDKLGNRQKKIKTRAGLYIQTNNLWANERKEKGRDWGTVETNQENYKENTKHRGQRAKK